MKGQYFTLDVIIAALIGIVGMILLLGYWQYSLENSPLLSDSLNKEALKVSQLLFTSYGEYAVLDENGRITSLDKLKQKVSGLSKSQPYDICVVLKDDSGNIVVLKGDNGKIGGASNTPCSTKIAKNAGLMAKVERALPYEIKIPPSTPGGDISYSRGIAFLELYVYYS